MTTFTPISAAIGGALIGLAAVLLMLLTGRLVMKSPRPPTSRPTPRGLDRKSGSPPCHAAVAAAPSLCAPDRAAAV